MIWSQRRKHHMGQTHKIQDRGKKKRKSKRRQLLKQVGHYVVTGGRRPPRIIRPARIFSICLHLYFLILTHIVFSVLAPSYIVVPGRLGPTLHILLRFPAWICIGFHIKPNKKKLNTYHAINGFRFDNFAQLLRQMWGNRGPELAIMGSRGLKTEKIKIVALNRLGIYEIFRPSAQRPHAPPSRSSRLAEPRP